MPFQKCPPTGKSPTMAWSKYVLPLKDCSCEVLKLTKSMKKKHRRKGIFVLKNSVVMIEVAKLYRVILNQQPLKKSTSLWLSKCLSVLLTTVDNFLFPKVALSKHLYSLGSGIFPVLGFGFVRPSSEVEKRLCYIF